MSKLLRVAGLAEAGCLIVLLLNLLTWHAAAVTGLVGPLHGTAYLAVVTSALLMPVSAGVRLRALLPGVGGLLALRCARRLPDHGRTA